MSAKPVRVGLVGARGHVGRELLELLVAHPGFELTLASSRELDGQPITSMLPQWPDTAQRFKAYTPEQIADAALDIVVLALPNKVSKPFVEAIDAAGAKHTAILDLSADWRFDAGWQYGWPERFREQIKAHRRIANPGCYATGMQTALWPICDLVRSAQVFGVSGYSGAGTTPSPKNDPEVLRDNLLPYGAIGHTHELEVSYQLSGLKLAFMPHVAPFFRGIMLTINVQTHSPVTAPDLLARYARAYNSEPLVKLLSEAPLVRDNMSQHHVAVGGVAVSEDRHRVVVYATLDNLLKGAATQALQNMNLLAGFDELTGITPNA